MQIRIDLPLDRVAAPGRALTALRAQGLLFCAIGTVVAGVSAASGMAPACGGTTGLLLAALIVLPGVAHGALDTVFAKELMGVSGQRGWIGFALAYLGAALLVLLAWQQAPTWCLAGFLLLSALHFSGDPQAPASFLARLLYGGTLMVLPALPHGGEMARLFGFLVTPQDAAALAGMLHVMGRPWLLATLLAAAWQVRTDWLNSLEMAVATLVALVAPPLLAFTVFFCAMHSPRHMLRTWHYAGAGPVARLGRAALLPMLGTFVLGAAGAYCLRTQPLEAGLMQLLFIGLAALTVPHMTLVERARWSGWVKPRAATP